ncbi:RNA polymerase [Bacteroidia bacterium]|nr:RNA polymerase [Bacteroidia bacterium]GHU88761.1 RNA polymerase [Bacteroidia bacterium]
MKLSYKQNSESILWNQFLEGDRLAFARIYELYVQKLYHYGLKLSPDKDFVMDCIHDLFVNLFQNRKTIGNTNNILFYLIRSLKNNMNRRLAREQEYFDNYSSLENLLGEQPVDEPDFTDYKSQCLQRAVNQLSKRQKEVIHLCYFDNFNNEEIAQIMDINYQSVRNMLHQALKTLRKCIPKNSFLFF